ncbi:MAG: hypothetical protein WCL37_01190 [Chrysiogenales bacterium]
MEYKIELKVNDQTINLNPFVQKIIGNVILGAIQSLDKIPEPPQRIEITMQSEKN